MENNGILIRNFKEEDLEQVKKLVEEFHQESLSHYGTTLNDETISNTIKIFSGKNIGLVADKNGVIIGCLGGVISKSMFDNSAIIGQEAMWYVSKKERTGTCGYRLLMEFERECFRRGADFVYMANMENLNAGKLGDFYLRNGYEKIQTIYKKKLKK